MADRGGDKMTKHDKKALKKLHKVQQTLLRHNNIPSSSAPTPHLVIGNGGLGNDVDRESIEKTFSEHGAICDIVMLPQKPYCFVTFSSTDDAERARQALHGKPLSSHPSVVLYITYVEKVPGMAVPSSVLPPGLVLLEDYVTEEEEEKLLASVDWSTTDTDPTTCLKHRRVKHYGYEFIYGINNVTPDNPLDEKIPQECSGILEDLVSRGVFPKQPDQLTVNQYQPGQGIPPHIDTHSAFDGAIVALSLGSPAVMEFVDPQGQSAGVLLPRRSLVVMDGESRYAWTHAIAPRKSDVVAIQDYGDGGGEKLTLVKRGVRTSFTFRLVRRSPCNCVYPEHCDSQKDQQKANEKESKAALPKSTQEAKELEATHVHQVYDEIASHFSATRHTQWPLVADFLKSREEGALIADVGCGNGKYLPSHNNSFNIGCDRSKALCEISGQRGFQVFVCDCLAVPLREGVFDAAVCIAVIHHLSTAERRTLAVEQLAKLLRPGGKALISVWALEQERNKEKSNYLKESKVASDNQSSNIDPSKDAAKENELNVRTNRTHFKDQDMLVPWHLRSNEKPKEKSEETEKKDTAPVFHRYYHLFTEGELEILCNSVEGIKTVNSYYDKGNWCVIFEKE